MEAESSTGTPGPSPAPEGGSSWLVFADAGDTEAKETLAGVYDRLGHGAENGTWRNFYLTSAMELRHGENTALLNAANPEMVMALTTGMLLDSIAVRIDGPRAWHEDLTIDLVLTDEDQRHRLTLHNGALTHRTLRREPRTPAGLTLTLTKPQLLGVLAGKGLDGVTTDGDPALLTRLFSYVTQPDRASRSSPPEHRTPRKDPAEPPSRPGSSHPRRRRPGRGTLLSHQKETLVRRADLRRLTPHGGACHNVPVGTVNSGRQEKRRDVEETSAHGSR
ncbi:alkyl sulfatase C-terminal domain-containing protein [Streptomyces sp. NPDC093795]|uniref:alkyl sulfatase C-terminal domain-containing protein n=1 Tax=Streptomyces sp. NPDC093795 TaxID=3366051 RepID=UPI00380BBE9F